MQFAYQTDRLKLEILPPEAAAAVCRFYVENKDFLEPFEPKRASNFYTQSFHYANLSCERNGFLKMEYFRYWIFLPEENLRPIGSVCFSNVMHGAFEQCMLGYKLDQNVCGNGYMFEALSTLIPPLVEELQLHRIEAYVQPDNGPSIRLLERLNFTQEGYIKQFAEINGEWTDHLLYSYLVKGVGHE